MISFPNLTSLPHHLTPSLPNSFTPSPPHPLTGQPLGEVEVCLADVVYSPELHGFSVVMGDGKAMFISAKSAKYEPQVDQISLTSEMVHHHGATLSKQQTALLSWHTAVYCLHERNKLNLMTHM